MIVEMKDGSAVFTAETDKERTVVCAVQTMLGRLGENTPADDECRTVEVPQEFIDLEMMLA